MITLMTFFVLFKLYRTWKHDSENYIKNVLMEHEMKKNEIKVMREIEDFTHEIDIIEEMKECGLNLDESYEKENPGDFDLKNESSKKLKCNEDELVL